MCRIIVLMFTTLAVCINASGRYDVVVYGATPAGISTAVSLARKGKQVLLVEQTMHVGGMYSSGLMTAEVMHMKIGCISGLAKDYYIKLGYETPEGFFHRFKHGDPAYFFECKTAERTFLNWLDEYKQWIDVLYGLHVLDVKKDSNNITSITLSNKIKYEAAYFVDCSYEGDLMKFAGVSYVVGRESREAFGEQYAGIRYQPDTLYGITVDEYGQRLPFFNEYTGKPNGAADDCVNAYNYRCVLTKADSNKVAFTRPEDFDSSVYNALADFLARNPDTNLNELFGIINRGNGKTGFNTRQSGAKSISVGLLGLQCAYPLADSSERENIKAFYKQYTKGLFYFLSNSTKVPEALRGEMAQYGYAKDEFTGNDHFPYYLYIREALRLQGEYIFTEHDILHNRTKSDAILLGSHWLDCHSIQKIALSDTSYINEGNIWVKIEEPYEIPYRVILPREEECKNLLVPVAVSASHVGFSSIRLESTWMQLGHAAGTAISLAMEQNTGLHQLSVPCLQRKLRDEGMVVKLEDLDIH